MYLKYGSYTHAQNEPAIQIGKRALFSPRGFRQSVRETWRIAGFTDNRDAYLIRLLSGRWGLRRRLLRARQGGQHGHRDRSWEKCLFH